MAAPSASVPPAPHDTSHAVDGHVAGVEHGAAHGAGGLPQLDMQHWGGQVVWLLLIFAVLYLLLAKVFLPRLREVRDQRAGAISGAIETARQVQAEAAAQAELAAAEVAAARTEARSAAAAAKARVTEAANARRAEDEAEMNQRIAKAEAEIAAAREAAMAHVGEIADETARAIVGRLTGKDATAAELAAAKGVA